MKFTVMLKDPDGVWDSIEDAVRGLVFDGLSNREAELVREARKEAIRELCGRWFKYGEYLEVEIDTEAETCTVLPAGDR